MISRNAAGGTHLGQVGRLLRYIPPLDTTEYGVRIQTVWEWLHKYGINIPQEEKRVTRTSGYIVTAN